MRKLTINIFERGTTYRKGRMYLNGQFVGFTIERVDAYIYKETLLTEIEGAKEKLRCAIPYGTYEFKVVPSDKFHFDTPRLYHVPGFNAIEIHPGNSSVDSLGCILIGSGHTVQKDWVSDSVKAFNQLMLMLPKDSSEPMTITIQDGLSQPGNVSLPSNQIV